MNYQGLAYFNACNFAIQIITFLYFLKYKTCKTPVWSEFREFYIYFHHSLRFNLIQLKSLSPTYLMIMYHHKNLPRL